MKYRFLLIFLLWTPAALSLPISGRVKVSGRPGGMNVPTIVYAEALDVKTPVQPGKFQLAQRNKAFSPHLLAIPVGSTVGFPNEDLIFHNVFSLGKFDLGLYRNGESKSQTFASPATYRVFCNIHPQMAAVILVLPTSYITEVDAGGSYRLDLPAGRYRITAWSERAQQTSTMEVTVGPGNSPSTELALDESRFVELPHKDKNGRDYPRSAYGVKKP